MKKRLLSLLLSVLMLTGLLPQTALADGAADTVTITFAASAADTGFYVQPQQLTVQDGLAESYGYTVAATDHNSVAVDAPTVADALVAAHVAKYGDAFTAATAADYLAISSSGMVTKAFGRSATASTFVIDGAMPADENATGYMADTARLIDNNVLEYWFLADTSYWSDYYSFFTEREKTVQADEAFTLTLKGESVMYLMSMGAMSAVEPLSADGDSDLLTIGTVNEDGTLSAAIAGKTTDENGQVTLSFAQPGTYLVTASGYCYDSLMDDYAPLALPWCRVTVQPAAASGEMLTATPSTATIQLYDAAGAPVDAAQGSLSLAGLQAGQTYSYTVSAYGYVAQTGTYTAGDGAVAVTLAQAPQNPAIDPSVTAAWPNFRGSDTNMGITAAATPKDAQQVWSKWHKSLGTGYANAPSVQIIADDALVVMCNTGLFKLDLQTGEVLANATMAKAPNWGYIPPIYAEGMIFCPLSGGTVQAFDAKTLTPLWCYTDPLGGQSLSPITYADGKLYTGFWNSETKDANYVCLTVTDEDPSAADEAKNATWIKTTAGGYYWAGAVAVGDAVIVGTDNGVNDATSDGAHLYALDKNTGAEISALPLAGDQRSSVVYSAEKGRVYFTTKAGDLGSAAVDAASGALSDLKIVHLANQSTSTPVVYGDRVYFCAGSGVSGGADGNGNFVAADADTLAQLYAVPLAAYPQSSPLLSTAYVQDEGKLYFYTTYNGRPGGITLIRVAPQAAGAQDAEKIELFDASGFENACICSIIAGTDGTLYYKNDSGNIFAVAGSEAYLAALTASVGTGLATFRSDKSDYELVVPIGTAQVTFTETASDGAVVQMNGADTRTVVLENGTATAVFTVQKGTATRTYTVTIREAAADAALSALKVTESNSFSSTAKALTPAFAPETTGYAVTDVGASRSFVNVWPDAADANAAITVYAEANVQESRLEQDGSIAVTGTNSGHDRYAIYFADDSRPAVIRIEVTAEDGVTTQSYRLLLAKSAAVQQQYAAAIALDQTTVSLSAAQPTTQLTATVTDTIGTGAAETLVWRSSNEQVATVDQNGLVSFVGSGTATVTVSGAFASASCAVSGTAAMQQITVAAYDYNAGAAGLAGASQNGVLFEQVISIPQGTGAAQAVEQAAAAAGVSLTLTTGYTTYVSEIGGLTEGTGGGYAGWCLRYNNDDFANLGLDTLTLSNGDRLELHYSVNADTTTDDIGNGWYGLPIVTSLTLGGRTVAMSKQTTYDENFMATTAYYLHDAQGGKTAMQGTGTAADPFIIPIKLASGSSLTALTASYETTLGAHYRVVAGLDGAQDYSSDRAFTLATPGGSQTTHYVVRASVEAGGSSGGGGNNNISVSFRLIGATRSSTDVDMGAGAGSATYQSWIKSKNYSLDRGATVYDLFTKALDAAGLRYVGADTGYVQTIYAPAGYGGYALSEFTNGPRSGWMYAVNGSHVDDSLKSKTLHDGDVVIWHYVSDYAYEVSDWVDDGTGHPSQGDASTWVDWSAIADTNPPSGGGSAGGDIGGTTDTPDTPDTSAPDASANTGFTDITDHWAQQDILTAVENGWMNGTSDTTFTPNGTLSRAMLATILYRMEGEPAVTASSAYTDVPTGEWYTDAVIWATENGIVSGYGDGLFGPQDAVTREQMATMLYRFVQMQGGGFHGAWTFVLAAPDADAVADWSYEAMCWCVTNGIVGGKEGGRLDPHGTATRAEAATVLVRLAAHLSA